MIYYLKFTSKEEAVSVLYAAEPNLFWNDNGSLKLKGSHNFAMFLVGNVYHNTGVMLLDNEGYEYPEQILVDGYHINANVVGRDLPECLLPFVVYPVTPSVTWG